MKKAFELKPLTESELNYIRGKARVGAASIDEIRSVFIHLDYLEMQLESLDNEDFFGTEGWRHRLLGEDV